MCHKICAKIYFLNEREREGNHVNGFWLYFMACAAAAARVARVAAVASVDVVLPLPMLCTVASSIMLIKALEKKG